MKLHRLALLTVCLLGMTSLAIAGSPEQRGLELAKKVDVAQDGYKGESSTMEMVLVNAHGEKTTRKMKSEQIEVAGDGDRSRIEFEWPADVKGTRMLTWTHKTGNDDQWLFLPAINRVKRISSGNKSGSFMGSEFAYEDLGSQEVEKYKHKYLADETLNGRKTWKLERVPVDSESGYSKLVSWVDQEYMNPLKIEYYDRKGELLKTATFSGYSKQGKWWRPGGISMVNHQTKKESHLTWRERKLSIELKDKAFESDELGG
jgi:outer membrane lipoprotein-sorting protein